MTVLVNEVKINRKVYSITAVICDVSQDILGMDFMNKYRLGFELDDFDQTELFITDKRSQIKALLQIVTVPMDLPRPLQAVSQSPHGNGGGPELC